MLQRSQNFSPFPRADNFVFQGDGPSKKIWCLDHQHLIKIYIDKITGHISYENPASKEHRRISPQTSGAPPGKPPRLPRIETIAQSGIWCLGGRSQPPHWSASILGRKWDRFKSVTTYFVTRATKKWSPLKWPAQMILVSFKKKWTFSWILDIEILHFKGLWKIPRSQAILDIFGGFCWSPKTAFFGRIIIFGTCPLPESCS